MAKDDGGSAFPRSSTIGSGLAGSYVEDTAQEGMSLRDYFAAKAMAAFLTSPSSAGETAVESPSQCAEWAYQQADAMLAERRT